MSSRVPQPTIMMTPPPPRQQSQQQQQQQQRRQVQPSVHPRRPPAHRSVSLLHSHRGQQERISDSSSENNHTKSRSQHPNSSDNSPSSLAPLTGKASSGESSNAEKWFEQSNNQVRDQDASFADNDPPFFMRNSSSSDDPAAEGQRSALRYLATDPSNSLPMRAGLLHLGTDGSSTEDFRSVIDDLTIENKKLKRRLKKYENLHDSHLKDEKLFEVRIHGLPAEKKRELEETLRNFASDLNAPHSTGFPSNGYEGLRSLLNTSKATSSSATSLQHADSAYASMSASGGQASSTSDSKLRASAQSAKSRHQNIHTYLHHIPEGLLPQQNPATMSEKAKKKLVVRRLEQIFAGTGAAAGGHQQAEQQQDVSHSAARADRIAEEAQGQRSDQEGYREAKFMPEGAIEDIAELPHKAAQPAPASREVKIAVHNGNGQSSESKVEQRPTRPLDLDPHRAQIPSENMRYIRHLGFELPDLELGSPQDNEGWVYLNLLINMAQLHTISVTADFVRTALSDCSRHLELSSDGRRVRWKGELSVTRTSSNGGESSLSRTPDGGNSSQSPRKRVRLSKEALKMLKRSQKGTGSSTSRTQAEPSRFAYTPLFFRKDSTGDEDSSIDLEDEEELFSPFHPVIGGDSSGMTSSGVRTASTRNKKKKHDDGPIIFYNNARFCTDLSGDHKPIGSQGAPAYHAANVVAIGKPQQQASSPKLFFEKRGPLASAADLPEPMDLEDNPIPESMELNFPPVSPGPKSADASKARPFDFEVTGIGGVYPADNFAISVESHHAVVEQAAAPKVITERSVKQLPPKLAKILEESKTPGQRIAMHKQVVTSKTELLPSALPPALNYMLTESDSLSDDEGSDADEQMSISPDSPDALSREPAPQQLDLPYTHFNDSDAEMDDEGEYDEEGDDSESDGSLDLLAAAREVDPDAVRAREREYDANMAERLAEEIPAGSSAATAGGGSGFASPASGVSKAAYQRAIKEARRSLHRQQTADASVPALAPAKSSREAVKDDRDNVPS